MVLCFTTPSNLIFRSIHPKKSKLDCFTNYKDSIERCLARYLKEINKTSKLNVSYKEICPPPFNGSIGSNPGDQKIRIDRLRASA